MTKRKTLTAVQRRLVEAGVRSMLRKQAGRDAEMRTHLGQQLGSLANNFLHQAHRRAVLADVARVVRLRRDTVLTPGQKPRGVTAARVAELELVLDLVNGLGLDVR